MTIRLRECIITSMCSLCGNNCESAQHLFCDCPFARQIWSRLSIALNRQIDTLNVLSIVSVCAKPWSSQAKDVVSAAIVNCF